MKPLLFFSLVFNQNISLPTKPVIIQDPIIHQTKIQPLSLLPMPQLEELPELEQIRPKIAPESLQGNGYQAGQCTAFVKDMRPDIPNNWGNASEWFRNAQSMGWPTGTEPKVGAIGWTLGHVVYVIAVSGDSVTYKDMNGRYIPFEINVRTVASSSLLYIY